MGPLRGATSRQPGQLTVDAAIAGVVKPKLPQHLCLCLIHSNVPLLRQLLQSHAVDAACTGAVVAQEAAGGDRNGGGHAGWSQGARQADGRASACSCRSVQQQQTEECHDCQQPGLRSPAPAPVLGRWMWKRVLRMLVALLMISVACRSCGEKQHNTADRQAYIRKGLACAMGHRQASALARPSPNAEPRLQQAGCHARPAHPPAG